MFLFFILFVSCLKLQAYIQNLETSRIRLSQLEQEMHRTRTQVISRCIVCYGCLNLDAFLFFFFFFNIKLHSPFRRCSSFFRKKKSYT